MKILGIETSCDETAAAVVENGHKLLSNVVASPVDLHTAYGGVVPEIAARSHIESILPVINKALEDAFGAKSQKVKKSKSQNKDFRLSTFDFKTELDPWDQIDAIAVTQGPGLIGSLLIGVLTARTLAIAKQKPLYAVNHVQAHPYASFITEAGSNFKNQNSKFKLVEKAPQFPMLALIVSGGHTQLALFKNHLDYKLLGQTTDDAVGEAFDKVAKMLGLPYPGGPSIASAAKKGNPNAFQLPKAKFDNVRGLTYHKLQSDYRFSFSGLKTAVLRLAQERSGHDYTFPSSKLPEALSGAQKADIAASFQHTVIETLVDTLKKAEIEFQPKSIVIAGGVAANQELRKQATKQLTTSIIYPDVKLCTDNAAMVATFGYYQSFSSKPSDPCSLEVNPALSM